MTTTLRNAQYAEEITAFMRRSLPCNPVPFLMALVDSVREHGTDWIKSDDGKALLHTVNQIVHGQDYSLNGTKEFQRLEKIYGDRKIK